MKKNNVSLMIGLSIPILMTALIAASIYLPRFFTPAPKFDFLYASNQNYGGGIRYVLEEGRIVEKEFGYLDKDTQKYSPPSLFIYDTAKNESRRISIEEAKKLSLFPDKKSPDGFEVVQGGGSDSGFVSFLFYSSSGYGQYYLKKGNYSKRLDIEREYYYGGGFDFLSWIGDEHAQR